MFDTQASPYSFAGNFGTSFLDSSTQSMMNPNVGQGGVLGMRFGDVMSSMTNNINQGALQGRMPFFDNAQTSVESAQAKKLGVQTFGGLTAGQISAQMNLGGPLSVLPMLGNSFIPKLIFPLAGLWSLFDGIKSMKQMQYEATVDASVAKLDPSQLSYNQTVEKIYTSSDSWNQLGPFGVQR